MSYLMLNSSLKESATVAEFLPVEVKFPTVFPLNALRNTVQDARLFIAGKRDEIDPKCAAESAWNLAGYGLAQLPCDCDDHPMVVSSRLQSLEQLCDECERICEEQSKVSSDSTPTELDPGSILVIIQVAEKVFDLIKLWRNR